MAKKKSKSKPKVSPPGGKAFAESNVGNASLIRSGVKRPRAVNRRTADKSVTRVNNKPRIFPSLIFQRVSEKRPSARGEDRA